MEVLTKGLMVLRILVHFAIFAYLFSWSVGLQSASADAGADRSAVERNAERVQAVSERMAASQEAHEGIERRLDTLEQARSDARIVALEVQQTNILGFLRAVLWGVTGLFGEMVIRLVFSARRKVEQHGKS